MIVVMLISFLKIIRGLPKALASADFFPWGGKGGKSLLVTQKQTKKIRFFSKKPKNLLFLARQNHESKT